MIKHYIYLTLLVCAFINPAFAQITINTTVGSTGYTGSNNSGTGAYITFVIENTSGGDILLTNVGNWTTTAHNGTTSELYYTSTSLSGSVSSSTSVPTPPWVFIKSGTVSGIVATGVNNVLSNINFVVPNNAIYRFALTTTGTNYYSGSGVGTCTPNSFNSSGVYLRTGDYQISGSYIGYGYTNNPRFFTGSITYTSACAGPTGLASSNVTNNSATLSWNAVTGSQGYEYVFDQVAGNPSGSGTPTSLTTYNATGLSPNTTYYMHVRNKCSSTSFSSWVTTSFTTVNFISCYAPASVSASNMTSSSATISWAAVAGTQGYEYKIDQTATGPSSGWASTTATTTNVTGLTGGTGYFAHVRNVCQPTDKSVWFNYPFTTPTCNPPTNILMSNITDSAADVLWSQMTNANKYEYVVDFSNQNPTSGYMTSTGITTHLTGLSPNSKYYIHVRSRCFTVDSSAWKLDSFITKMVCYAPAVQVNYLGTDNPYAYWAPIPTAIAYEYALTHTATTPAFGQEIYTTYVSPTLDPDGKDYYLHVRAKCNSMFTTSQWSTVALRTGSTGISSVNSSGQISVYPNPAHDILHINGAKGATYKITDIAGKVIATNGIAGTEATIDINNIPAGIYILDVDNAFGSQRFKISKQ